jgi:hypothetical protein
MYAFAAEAWGPNELDRPYARKIRRVPGRMTQPRIKFRLGMNPAREFDRTRPSQEASGEGVEGSGGGAR